jgi:hypothetical protein
VNQVIDFDDPTQKGLVLSRIRPLEGKWRLELVRYRPRRSDRQNAAYWPLVVEPFADYLTSEWGEYTSPETAHEILKQNLLRRRMVNKATGETLEYVGSTTELDTAEFSDYFERCAEFLAQNCGITVQNPDPAWRSRANV